VVPGAVVPGAVAPDAAVVPGGPPGKLDMNAIFDELEEPAAAAN